MSVVSWRSDVNQAILDMTTISMGEGGLKEDSSESGYKQRRALSLASPSKFSVTMDFNWLDKDENGNSEFDRFQNWYQYRHQYGTNPFWFPSISRFNINGTVIDNNTQKPRMCQYVITSSPNFSKSGFCMRCTMTWEEVYTGIIEVDEFQAGTLGSMNVENGRIYLNYAKLPTELPTPTSFVFGHKKQGVSYITAFDCYAVTSSCNTVTFYVNSLSSGTYTIGIGNFTKATPQPTASNFSSNVYYTKDGSSYKHAESFTAGTEYYLGELKGVSGAPSTYSI